MLYRGEKAEFIEMLGKKTHKKNADQSWRYHAAESCSSNLSP